MAAAVEKIDDIFWNAAQLPAGESREQYLSAACADDPELRQRVEKLLAAQPKMAQFLEKPFCFDATEGVAPRQSADRPSEEVGTMVGPYKLHEQIGEGGMGLVYMAEQQRPVRRLVALKLVKPGMDSRQVIARFEAERQALAMMDHPNIARVLDAGTTDTGRPFFVMELVRGIPINEFCDQKRLTVRQRLELFIQVCQAVQHAHQKGIIHRDLKPTNVLVTMHDVIAVPKVIDFGIAKALGQQLTDHTLVTGFSQMIGTPLYMSPEQADMNQFGVDTRSDIYSLGVILYELLTGTTPFDKETLTKAGLDEMRRVIREQEPPRPSARLSTLEAKALSTVSDRRSTDPRRISTTLRGELDWIVMKALEKDRNRRYESANAFAADIQRYLVDEPVHACPPSTLYQLKKLLRRHRAPAITASVLVVALLITAVMGFMLAIRERQAGQQRILVQQGINDALAKAAGLRGQSRTADSDGETALSQAREQMQRALALAESGPADAQLVAQVRQLATELDQEQRDQQLLSALEAAWLAEPSLDWDRRYASEKSVPLLRDALTADGLVVGRDDPLSAAARIRSRHEKVQSEIVAALYEWYSVLLPPIGVSLQQSGGVAYVSPESPAGRDGRLKKGDRIVGIAKKPDGAFTKTSGMTVQQITQLLRGDPGTIVCLEVLPNKAKQSQTLEIPRDATAAWLWAVIEAADPDPWRRKVREASDLQDDTLRRAELEKLVDAVDIAGQPVRILNQLGAQLMEANAIDRATTFLKDVWQHHPGDIATNISLAICLRRHNPPQVEESLRYYTAAIATRPQSPVLRNMRGITNLAHGKKEEANADYRAALRINPDYPVAHTNLGNRLREQGKLDEAIAEHREAIRLDPGYKLAHNNLGVALKYQGKLDEAIACFKRAIEIDPKYALAHTNLGDALCGKGKLEEAIAEHREAIELDPKHVAAHLNLGRVLMEQRKFDEAMSCIKKAIELDPKDAMAHNNLGAALGRQGKLDEAIASYKKAIELDPNLALAHRNLSADLWAQKKVDEAITHVRKAIELDPKFVDAHINLGIALHDQKKLDEAIACCKTAIELDPKYPRAHSILGEVLRAQKNVDEAIACFRKAIELDPKYASAHGNLGLALAHQGKLDEAIACFRKVIELDPKLAPAAHTNLGIALKNQGKLDEAIACYKKAIELDSKLAQPHSDLGVALKLQGKEDEALDCYRQALELFPNDASVHNGLAWLRATSREARLRDPALALKHAQRAVKLDPKNSNFHNTLGAALYRSSDWPAAITALEKSIELSSKGNSENWTLLAMAHWQLGRKDEARTWFEKAVSNKPERPDDDREQLHREAAELLGMPPP